MTADLCRTAGPTAALAVADHVSRTYDTGSTTATALVDVTLAVQPGARWALTGPSGSGKSTLLHLLAGLDRPTAGTVSWPGLGDDPLAAMHRIGMVFQGPSLIPELDAVENVAYPLLLAGRPDREASDRAHASLDLLGLTALAAVLPGRMSGGQAQRVAVARVLAAEPRLILADEPTGQLDRDTGRHVLDVLRRAADTIEAAVIVSTHDNDVAALFPERYTMTDGRFASAPTTHPGVTGTSP